MSHHSFPPSKPALLARCVYGNTRSPDGSKICHGAIKSIPTALGTCYTINPGGEFGKIKRVGSKWGLEVAVDMQWVTKNKKRFFDDDLNEVKVRDLLKVVDSTHF